MKQPKIEGFTTGARTVSAGARTLQLPREEKPAGNMQNIRFKPLQRMRKVAYHHSLVTAVIAAVLIAPSAHAEAPGNKLDWSKARQVTSEKQLETAAAAAKPLKAQLGRMTLPVEKKPAPTNSLYTKSIILSDGVCHTLVPIGSVLHLPANLRSHVLAAPQGEFLLWPKFLERNAAWLGAKEVPLKMAQGDAKLGQMLLKHQCT
jgi:hypothetical protein